VICGCCKVVVYRIPHALQTLLVRGNVVLVPEIGEELRSLEHNAVFR
jgi:hypothetical protein